jgi:ABC-type multidrug transport system ATPase subunit/pSer/pThr/pTyr-binding forkhead associated (FHA) protein
MGSPDQPLAGSVAPAYLVALDAGFSYREYRIEARGATIGRDAGRCDIVVAGLTVSRRHVRIGADNGGHFVLEDLDSTNGVFLNGTRVAAPAVLRDGDLISLGSATPAHLRFQSRSSRDIRRHHLPASEQWVIGRSPDCDIPLPFEPTVSARHAVLSHRGGVLRIMDNHSLNGTWVNGRPVRQEILSSADTVVVGATHFNFQMEDDGTLAVRQRECGQSVKLECVGLTRTARRGRKGAPVLLEDITLSLEPGEFVGILGPSGAGKTTLLTTLNGFARPCRGQVLFNETLLDSGYAMFRNTIGYVPQDDILHPELNVEDSLEYTARLRLSPDLSSSQRSNIVSGTIETLGLNQVRQTPIHQLSGGQRKRVSIGAELLVRPSILFLDEPTSGLDPSTEDRLMRHFRSMAHSGTTVVITTHVLYNLALLDKVVILAQGRLVFFGTPDEALLFFSEGGTALTRPTRIFDLLTGADRISGQDSGSGVDADQEERAVFHADRYRQSLFYQRNIGQRLSPSARSLLSESDGCPGPTLAQPSPRLLTGRLGTGWGRRLFRGWSGADLLRSWLILSQRHLQIRCSSRQRLLLFLLIPLVLAAVTLSQPINGVVPDEAVHRQKVGIGEAIARGGPAMERQLKVLLSPAGVYDPRSGADLLYSLRHEGVANLPVPMSVLLMLVMTAIFSGTLIACLEISTEQSIYQRERRSHLHILPYLGSKLPFCLTITALQCLIFLGICWFNPTLRQTALIPVWLAMVGIAWSSVAVGLFLSTVDPTAGRFSVMLAIAVVLPQLILSGGLGPDFYAGMEGMLRWMADLLPARWGLEMVCTALFGSLTGEGGRWIPGFVRGVIGFDFGGPVYYTGGSMLMVQSLLWLFFCAGFLKYRDLR